MLQMITKSSVVRALTGVVLLVASSAVMADQLTLSYIGPEADTLTKSVDISSSAEDLAMVAGLLGANGASVSNNPNAGIGSLADIAKALTNAAPMFAADIAQALAAIAPDQAEAIVAAVNSVPGVNTNAVYAAVHFGPPIRVVVPPTDQGVGVSDGLIIIEHRPSPN